METDVHSSDRERPSLVGGCRKRNAASWDLAADRHLFWGRLVPLKPVICEAANMVQTKTECAWIAERQSQGISLLYLGGALLFNFGLVLSIFGTVRTEASG